MYCNGDHFRFLYIISWEIFILPRLYLCISAEKPLLRSLSLRWLLCRRSVHSAIVIGVAIIIIWAKTESQTPGTTEMRQEPKSQTQTGWN